MRGFSVSLPTDVLDMIEVLGEMDGGRPRSWYILHAVEAYLKTRLRDLSTFFTTAVGLAELSREVLFENPVHACLEPHQMKLSEVYGLPGVDSTPISVRVDEVPVQALRRLMLAMMGRLYGRCCAGMKPEIADAICKQVHGRKELPRTIYRIGVPGQAAALTDVQDVLINARQSRPATYEIEVHSVARAHRALLRHGVQPLNVVEARRMLMMRQPWHCDDFLKRELGKEYVAYVRAPTGVARTSSSRS